MIHITVDPYHLNQNGYGKALIESDLWCDALIFEARSPHFRERTRLLPAMVRREGVHRQWKLSRHSKLDQVAANPKALKRKISILVISKSPIYSSRPCKASLQS